MIAILAARSDLHAQRVGQELSALNREYKLLDTRGLGDGPLIQDSICGSASISDIDGEKVSVAELRCVWMRRRRKPLMRGLGTEEARFCRQEWDQAFVGMMLNLQAHFVNPILADYGAVKPRQLALASRCGMRIPDTLITNDRDLACEFVEKHRGSVIHKAMSSPSGRLFDTRIWQESDRDALSDLLTAPVIFQELVSGRADVRVTVIGNYIIAARLATAEGRSPIDSRVDLDVRYEFHQLPQEVENNLLWIMSELGLLFGTIDLKISDGGEYVFFEINPQGQFLYVELLTGLPIAKTMAKFLASLDVS